ncbi:MAG: hypothetical protein A3D31_05525 [Candidatus Fluviicola riflensis]|nr:MAG: hypothetical protein CHH17_09490 [Candidatus Fluviicola riflensis]OGS79429.1 MAG: hypothetical protein A3D31_05525 [Candidatus Fluviicola riflensis]OGS86861.1 MAG: hypothetical protein A2724_04985 [Fluviicola sp. RIFCSPHIGHO2_01_FULL_43_53]OGS89651.1 MAG: hypothetical protein A3E30_01730 [Fluviicola sp. RIFCSPHIGHO2_12_FULL_43_24]
MKTLCSLAILLVVSCYSNAQQPLNKTSVSRDSKRSDSPETTFETYCLKNALSVIEVVEGKSSQYVLSGEVKPSSTKAASYVDYDIQLKEEETQYFQISGTNTILKAESLYRLRISYALTLQKL